MKPVLLVALALAATALAGCTSPETEAHNSFVDLGAAPSAAPR
ncbi:MAG TPA: hypothetical protein VNZ52_05105 [Candidatus Thermoplasmatota archaeon]|nr:hypothetical protein [Candidatus Thermoplasmatota archaeon]